MRLYVKCRFGRRRKRCSAAVLPTELNRFFQTLPNWTGTVGTAVHDGVTMDVERPLTVTCRAFSGSWDEYMAAYCPGSRAPFPVVWPILKSWACITQLGLVLVP